jgi:hypothetical protein
MHGIVRLAPLVLLLACSPSGTARSLGGEEHPSREQVIVFAKGLDVSTLDSSLASERLDNFLARAFPDASIRWISSDCENKPARFPRPPETPLCASVLANVGERGLRIHLVVGTQANPISGTPHLEKLYLLGSPASGRHTIILSSLSELPRVTR